jgi:SAM-dependent methyltransferase
MNATPIDARPGTAVYNRLTLRVYDQFVLGFSNRRAWRCPSPRLLAHYQAHLGARHLDIGVGTGYFLDHTRFPIRQPLVVLADLNPASLAATAERLDRYQPVTHELNVLEPFRLPEAPFDSVGLNYLLHCLPGTMAEKNAVFGHIAPQLRPGGVLFGSTILGRGVQHNAVGRTLMAAYNRKGIFSNREDDADTLRAGLARHFSEVEVQIEGVVAVFAAWR